MNVYRWNLRPEKDLVLEVRVTAPSVAVARREIRRFLVAHDGSSWVVECVARESTHAAEVALPLPGRGSILPD